MNSSIESHEPSPEFRARLEWQIATALRRDSRFATPVPNVYAVNEVLQRNSSKSLGATGRCKMPFLVHTVQLHCDNRSRSTLARNLTRPQ